MTGERPHYKLSFGSPQFSSPDEFPTQRQLSANVVGLNDLLARVRRRKTLYPTQAASVVRFYIQPGPTQCSAERDSFAGANPDSVTFTISGHFVDCPTCQ